MGYLDTLKRQQAQKSTNSPAPATQQQGGYLAMLKAQQGGNAPAPQSQSRRPNLGQTLVAAGETGLSQYNQGNLDTGRLLARVADWINRNNMVSWFTGHEATDIVQPLANARAQATGANVPTNPSNPFEQTFNRYTGAGEQQIKQTLQRNERLMQGGTGLQRTLYKGVSGAVAMAPDLLLGGGMAKGAAQSALTHGLIAGAPMAIKAGASGVREAQQAGVSTGRQIGYGLTQGIVNEAMNALPIGRILGAWGKPLAKQGLGVALKEGLLTPALTAGIFGAVSDPMNRAAQKVFIDPKTKIIDWQSMLDAGVTGATSALIISGLGMGRQSLSRRKAQAMATGEEPMTAEGLEELRRTIQEEKGIIAPKLFTDEQLSASFNKHIDDMLGGNVQLTPEAHAILKQRLMVNPITGVYTAEARPVIEQMYAARGVKPIIMYIDANGLSGWNEFAGHAAGTEVMKLYGEVTRLLNGRTVQAHGAGADELLAYFDPKQDVPAILEKYKAVQNKMANAEIVVEYPDGVKVKFTGATFSFGLAKPQRGSLENTVAAADKALGASKKEGIELGFRASQKGVIPPNVEGVYVSGPRKGQKYAGDYGLSAGNQTGEGNNQLAQGLKEPAATAAPAQLEAPQQGASLVVQPKGPKPQLLGPDGRPLKVSDMRLNTYERAKMFTPEERQTLTKEEFAYVPETNVAHQDQALRNVNANTEEVMSRLRSADSINGGVEAYEAAIVTKRLVEEARQTGDYSKLLDWTKTVAAKTRESARALQATGAAYEKFKTAAGAIDMAQRTVDKAQELWKQSGKKGKAPELTPDEAKFIAETMDRIKDLDPKSDEYQIGLGKVQQLIADKVPVKFLDKFKGLIRLSLLSSPKTYIRNFLGNVPRAVLDHITENSTGALIDWATSLKTGERTTVSMLPTKVKAMAPAAKQGFHEVARDWQNKIDMSPSRGQQELPGGRVFKNPTLNYFDNAVRTLLKLGDNPFYRAAEASRRVELERISKGPLSEKQELEVRRYALEKTFQNDSTLATRAQSIRDSLGVIGELVMPFTKTPANILDTLLDYSPVGMMRAVYHLGIRKTIKGQFVPFNQKLFVDRLSRSLTGTGIAMLGYAMAKSGIFGVHATGKASDDKDARDFQRNTGRQAYAINIGGKYYTYDWAQPVGSMLAMGADAFLSGKDKKGFLAQLGAGLEGAGNTLVQQSFLQGLFRMMSGYSPVAGVAKTLTEAPTMFEPTVMGQVARMVDPNVRQTGGAIDRMINKIPFASKTLPAKVDTLGRPVLGNQGRGAVSKALETFVSPGFFSKQENAPAVRMINDLYQKTGNNTIFPRVAPKQITIKRQTFALTPEQQNQLQQLMGQKTMEMFSQFAQSPEFNNLSDEAKIRKLSLVIDRVAEWAKVNFYKQNMGRLKANQ